MQDLNDLLPSDSGWELLYANAINDRGQIAAVGRAGGEASAGPQHALLLTPTSMAPEAAPQAPTGASARLASPPVYTQLELNWTDKSNNEAGFEIERKGAGGDWSKIAVTLPDTTHFTDIGLTPYTHYSYRVRAINGAGASAWSDEASGDTGILPLTSVLATVNFGDQPVGVTSETKTLTITNTGNGPLIIGSVSLTGANAGDFTLSPPNSDGATVAPDGHLTITIAFTPAAAGSRNAILTITDNSADSSHTVRLSGTGTVPALTISPVSLSFGLQPVGTTNGAQAIVLQNTGRAPLDIGSVTLAGANPDEYALTADGCSGGQLQPGQICTLNVRFTPAAVGSRGATLMISDSAAGSPHLVALSGEGIAPAANVSPSSVSFSDQLVGTSSGEQTIAVANNGSAPLTIHGVSLVGANPRDFLLTADLSGVVVAPGQSQTLSVRFAPTAAGSRTASLAIGDSAAGSPQVVALSGSGIAPTVQIGISGLGTPSSVNFGSQTLGVASAAKAVTWTNTGTAPLTLSSISLMGANAGDFALIADSGGTTLRPNATRTLTFRFTPKAAGSRSATLRIVDNAAGSPHTITLTGTGVAPAGGGNTGGGATTTPKSAELFIVAVDGKASHSKQVTVSPGQGVTLQLLVRFKNGAVLDLTSDASSRLWADPARGQFTAKNTWSAKPADAGKKISLYGRYYPPAGRQRIVEQVSITVKASKGRR